MKALSFIIVAAVLLVGAGCGKKERACDLSSVKVKSVALSGDLDDFAKDAILHELYARGARSSDKGVAIQGHIDYEDNRIVALNFTAEGANIAAAASLITGTKKDAAYLEDKELARSQSATEAVAKKVAEQVCDCVRSR
jgi:hypothetical protein